ncbi:TetR/AcrR family transcriptional regulator [Paraburkholderia sp. Ac-20347]|uniref:TetR/AcrR family transcriptional regulator n=1 Tax=Paraburkholderia sp. Ac-20347 TaxID=2703892 RepID=UPI00197E16B4|nr:TetR/AcrR family transcriptional regulator [Paraburkholderia sp. Ac-20347]MBN3808539.1 TetR/AcrR family transcriptional regulator [Paraburkholderia sp. Ac-20347]
MAMTRQFDEDAVLEKVLEIFWIKGWKGASMADLAEAANVQRGSLYHAYGGKEQLFQLAFDRYATRVLDETRTALDAPSAHAALQQFFESSIASMTAHVPPRGCLTTRSAIEADDASADTIQDDVRGLLKNLEHTIVEALSRDAIRASLVQSPEVTAQMIITFTRGLAVMERINHDPEQLREMCGHFANLLYSDDSQKLAAAST